MASGYKIQRLDKGNWVDVASADKKELTTRCRGYTRQTGVSHRAIDLATGKVVVECLPK